jgi:Protein of unknown function (DUF2786)
MTRHQAAPLIWKLRRLARGTSNPEERRAAVAKIESLVARYVPDYDAFRCRRCRTLIEYRAPQARYCSSACRQGAYRQRRRSARRSTAARRIRR